ncbi:MAG TPA: helix-turn-helix transcriptional regulator [Abditibacterium sp.]|jgi:transcriptional regulator with XRE-family HTH domain
MTNLISANRVGRPRGTGAPESDAIKRVRLELGLTQMDMAIRLGIAESTLQRLEKLARLPQSRGVRQTLDELAKTAGVEI